MSKVNRSKKVKISNKSLSGSSDNILEFLDREYKAITGYSASKFDSAIDIVYAIKNYYETIIAFMPHNVYWLDKDCILRGCNNNVAKLCGIPREDCVGLDYDKVRSLMNLSQGQTDSFIK